MLSYNWKKMVLLHLYLRKVGRKSTNRCIKISRGTKYLVSIKRQVDWFLNEKVGRIQ